MKTRWEAGRVFLACEASRRRRLCRCVILELLRVTLSQERGKAAREGSGRGRRGKGRKGREMNGGGSGSEDRGTGDGEIDGREVRNV